MGKGKLRKLLAVFTSCILVFGITGCTKKPKEKETETDITAKIQQTDDSIILINDKLSIMFSKTNGSLVSFKNVVTGTDFINESVGGNWAMTVDSSGSDVFKANVNSAQSVVITSRKIKPIITSAVLDKKASISLTYDVAQISGITVKQNVLLSDGGDSVEIDYEIENKAASDNVIINFTGAQLTGIKERAGKENWSLFWPYKEGKLYESAVSRVTSGVGVGTKMVAAYPVPFSMQIMQLYNDTESLDYIVKDSEGNYKEFNFGDFRGVKQYDNGVEVIDKISMTSTQFPYIAKGKTEKLPTISIGVTSRGGWYGGSDKYRKFTNDAGLNRTYTSMVDNWTGMTVLIANNPGVFASYQAGMVGASTTYADWVKSADSYGINTLCAIGWHEGGFDHMYPDYDFIENQGGEKSYKQMTEDLHTNGDDIIAYINGHIVDEQSNWSQQIYPKQIKNEDVNNMQQAAIKKVGFKYGETAEEQYERYMYFENYGALNSYAVCPSSIEFQDKLNEVIKKLRQNGTDGIWFDQIMEMPSLLCHDSSHGHKNPATAFSGGYKQMFEKFHNTMTTYGSTPYLFSSEGICDAYTKYIDVCGMMWQRKLGGRDNNGGWGMNDGVYWTPEITRYTMSAKILGLETAGAVQGSKNEFARAFLMGEPLLSSNYQPAITLINGIYSAEPDIFMHGRYMDAKGLVWGNEDVMATTIQAREGKSFSLQLYNNSYDEAKNMKVVMKLKDMGIDGNITSVKNLITGENVALQTDNSIIVSLADFETASYKVTYN